LLVGAFEACDKATALPKLNVLAVYGPLGLFDRLLIANAFDIFRGYKAPIVAERVNAIVEHETQPLSLIPPALWPND
jgi:hypothetical protein